MGWAVGEAVMGRWGVLAVLCLARVSMGLHLQAVAAVAPFLIADLGLGYGEVGTLIGIFLLPGAVLSPESRATGFGLFFTTNYVGFAILPAVAGVLVDLTGSPAAPIWFDAAIFATVIPLVLWFRW